MCGTTEGKSADSTVKLLSGALSLTVVGLLVSTIVLASKKYDPTIELASTVEVKAEKSNVPSNDAFDVSTIFSRGINECAGKKPKPGGDFDNYDCLHVRGPQAGANVTRGFKGEMTNTSEIGTPLTSEFSETQMCTVNVHWHLGTEHYSLGEYDENGDGPNGGGSGVPYRHRELSETVRGGFRCHHYNKDDTKFTKEYDWKHCIGMEVGETYEVHWPASVFGSCGTVNQYQTPFEDGVLCRYKDKASDNLNDLAQKIGVQAQIFTVINDEAYFYPDMMRGWIKDGEYGADIARYTGSTTGTSRSNEKCSAYSPITWQVDRKCHLISASSFDKLCYDMKMQRDNMKEDLHAHGSRELVKPSLVAANQETRRGLGHSHEHVHDIPHYHCNEEEHEHEHHEWF